MDGKWSKTICRPRRKLILNKKFYIFFIFILIILGCRGGGANPSNNASIPIIEPTPSSMYCQNEYYVESYPQLDQLKLNNLISDSTGIDYFIVEEGESEKPNINYLVTARYTGWLENGCVFDSSYTRNSSSVFPLSRVIQGWQIGITKIGKNGKILIKIPPELGYGSQGAPPRIPGNSTLYFYVELEDIQSVEDYVESQEKEKNKTN